jgi:hypothetical protein
LIALSASGAVRVGRSVGVTVSVGEIVEVLIGKTVFVGCMVGNIG